MKYLNSMTKLLLGLILVFVFSGRAVAQCDLSVSVSKATTTGMSGNFSAIATDSWVLQGGGLGPEYGVQNVHTRLFTYYAGGYHQVYTNTNVLVEEDAELTSLQIGTVPSTELFIQENSASLPAVALEITQVGSTNIVELISYEGSAGRIGPIYQFGQVSYPNTQNLFLKLIPQSGTFIGKVSTDDVNWTTVGTIPASGLGSVTFTGSINEGLNVFSGDTTNLTQATYANWLINGVDPTATGPGTLLGENNSGGTQGLSFQPVSPSYTVNMGLAAYLVIAGPGDCTQAQLNQLNAQIASVSYYNGFITMYSYDPTVTPTNFLSTTSGLTSSQGPTSANGLMNSTLAPTVTSTYSDMAAGKPYDLGICPVFQFYTASGQLVAGIESLCYGMPTNNVSGFDEGWLQEELGVTMFEEDGIGTPYSNAKEPNLHWQYPVTPFCTCFPANPDWNTPILYTQIQENTSYWLSMAALVRFGGHGAYWISPLSAFMFYYAIPIPTSFAPSGGYPCTNYDLGISPLDFF